jgi:hypothetical protein
LIISSTLQKDGELFGRQGIIENWLGHDDEAVSTMFNKLGHSVSVSITT